MRRAEHFGICGATLASLIFYLASTSPAHAQAVGRHSADETERAERDSQIGKMRHRGLEDPYMQLLQGLNPYSFEKAGEATSNSSSELGRADESHLGRPEPPQSPSRITEQAAEAEADTRAVPSDGSSDVVPTQVMPAVTDLTPWYSPPRTGPRRGTP